MTDEYILFCFQEANFQTRSMLIPCNLLNEKRQNDIKLLKKYSNSCKIKVKNVTYDVNNLLLIDIKCDYDEQGKIMGGVYVIDTPVYKLYRELCFYCNGDMIDEMYIIEQEDL